MKAGGDGEFKGTFTVKATRGDIVIKNQGYTEVQIPTCVPMAGNGTVGADGAVMTFMFRTDYYNPTPGTRSRAPCLRQGNNQRQIRMAFAGPPNKKTFL